MSVVAVRALPAPIETIRSLPQNIEAEQALLGAILVNNEAFYRVSDFLLPVHFFEPVHREIYEVAVQLIRVNKLTTAYFRPIAFYDSKSFAVWPKECPVSVAIIAVPYMSRTARANND